jgi:hypothetical protein
MENEQDSKDFFWQTYEKLPDSLKEALFSEENFNIISGICEKNGITDENIKTQISKYVGKTLMGLLPIKEFSISIELELNLDADVARAISLDIDNQIFSHLRIELNKLYLDKVAEKKIISDNISIEKEETAKPKEGDKPKEPVPAPAPKNNDTYREPII